MSLVEIHLNRWSQPVRFLDTRKVAEQIVRAWAETSPDGSSESLVDTLDRTLRDVVVALCDA